MNGSEFYEKLQPEYSKWLESMDKADCIAWAYSIAFMKELMYYIDEIDVEVPDDMDPAWFFFMSKDTADEYNVGAIFSNDTSEAVEFVHAHIQTAKNMWEEHENE